MEKVDTTRPNDTTKALERLAKSLLKKEAQLAEKLKIHFETVKQANGQPLNDKRNGQATLNRWEQQNNSLKKLQEDVEKTKSAIELEKGTIRVVNSTKKNLPNKITDLLESGELIQWRKYPNIFFVKGVEKARIIWDAKKNIIAHKFANTLTDKEQRKQFAGIFNALYASFNNQHLGVKSELSQKVEEAKEVASKESLSVKVKKSAALTDVLEQLKHAAAEIPKNSNNLTTAWKQKSATGT
jgi:hypothetical protein